MSALEEMVNRKMVRMRLSERAKVITPDSGAPGRSRFRAAFSRADITPRIGIAKIGWHRSIVPERILDPLFASVCVLETRGSVVALVSLDTLSVSRVHVASIRAALEERVGLRGSDVMIAATHNHAGPAIVRLGDVPADESYQGMVTASVVAAVTDAFGRLEEAEIGFGAAAETSVPHNRRVVLRTGLVETHGSLENPEALFVEGPIDPIITTIGVRSDSGRWLGSIVNLTCHPTHHGDDEFFSAGFPGVLASELATDGIPVTVVLNGALGNVHWLDPARPEYQPDMQEVGAVLASSARRALRRIEWLPGLRLAASSTHVMLPFREASDAVVAGTARGVQQLGNPEIYRRLVPRLLAEFKAERQQQAEVQAIVVGEHALLGIPAELFVEFGLEIKERAYPMRALIVGLANGMVGYIPHEAAFERGGYETTLGDGSKLAPEAGRILVQAALDALMLALGTASVD